MLRPTVATPPRSWTNTFLFKEIQDVKLISVVKKINIDTEAFRSEWTKSLRLRQKTRVIHEKGMCHLNYGKEKAVAVNCNSLDLLNRQFTGIFGDLLQHGVIYVIMHILHMDCWQYVNAHT